MALSDEERKFHDQLRLASDSDQNWLALHSALRVSFRLPLVEGDTTPPFDEDMYCVPVRHLVSFAGARSSSSLKSSRRIFSASSGRPCLNALNAL